MSGPIRPDPPTRLEAIHEARRLLNDFDDVPLPAMTALFYMNGFQNLRLALEDLLDALDNPRADSLVDSRADAGTGQPAAAGDDLAQLNTVLARAADLRGLRIAHLARGARFRGLSQVLSNLEELRSAFAADPALKRVTFLISRCVADFETAIENALSGYLAVAVDAMRDVMEIENLLLDFAVDPHRIEGWLQADARTLRTTYSAAEVRTRLHRAQVGAYATSAEASDYRAHSQALHVRPGHHPVADKGFSADQGWNGDAAYWEMFEHHRRLRHAVATLTTALSSDSEANRLATCELPAVRSAWERTQEMQAMYVAVLAAATDSTEPS